MCPMVKHSWKATPTVRLTRGWIIHVQVRTGKKPGTQQWMNGFFSSQLMDLVKTRTLYYTQKPWEPRKLRLRQSCLKEFETPLSSKMLNLRSIGPGRYLNERSLGNSWCSWHGFGYRWCCLHASGKCWIWAPRSLGFVKTRRLSEVEHVNECKWTQVGYKNWNYETKLVTTGAQDCLMIKWEQFCWDKIDNFYLFALLNEQANPSVPKSSYFVN